MYQTYADAIHMVIKRSNCRKILSIDESDGDKEVRAYRPSWGTDELQKFSTTVGDFTVKHLKKNADSC
ncbi:hypothetical protein PHYBLDRAFT_143459 [Phycomyces blakesleeanus NRRL 1555(-)]|uniref:Uncharacterized protein n=1 Tax=Phycomyces blakesleeanus (strain ATCC 8743b / DSM 1359 / FGSC 10004 / NBRC 33097 / NRRL 1555) TaxID=763407 RepID=A0A167N731_PHYB8|nr:hypothetical protein PHYBLDRAFT_143459 [Phycomyces blakesleeanus NRRL 1555(-)]OAD75194.1 hypothetical protein PHYBLDRAFT_143459 [Phycomyces blakesleeanus NRRL 1555(-)]|eukprot:XP_018293234.1 hypothetical protein PHYBLDRAFT_143459 [Phycomyces blakesleeanus NRRL 1555(-)]